MIKQTLKILSRWYTTQRRAVQSQWYTFRVKERAQEVGNNLTVRGYSIVNSNTKLGDNVNFMGLQIRGDGSVTIGDNFHSGPGVRILTRNHNFDAGDAIPYDDTYIRKPVHIEDNVWLGVDVNILPGVQIGEGAIVQAGSTVVDDVPNGAIVGGHPAKKFAERDMKHYRSLKKQKKFY